MSAEKYEQIVLLAKNLSRLERIQLVEAVIETLKQEFASEEIGQEPKPRRSLRGLWTGVSVSAEDIDEARREMRGNFPREDI